MNASQPVGLSPGAINGVGLFVNTATKAFLPFFDLARGVLPTDTAGSWTTPPPNLANITDGSDSSFAGTGILAAAAHDNITVTPADPDSNILYMRVKVGAWNPLGTGTAAVLVNFGAAGGGSGFLSTTSTTEVDLTGVCTVNVGAVGVTNVVGNQIGTATAPGGSTSLGAVWGFYCTATVSACSFRLYTLELWGIAR